MDRGVAVILYTRYEMGWEFLTCQRRPQLPRKALSDWRQPGRLAAAQAASTPA